MAIKKLKDYKKSTNTRAAQAQQGLRIRDLISQFEKGNTAPLVNFIKENADLQTLVKLYDEGEYLDRADLKETLQSPLTKHLKEKPEDAYKVHGVGAYDLVKQTKKVYAGALVEKYKQGDKQPLLDAIKNSSEFLFDVASVNSGVNQEMALAAISNKYFSVSNLPTEFFNNSDFLAEALKVDNQLYARMAGACARNIREEYSDERKKLMQEKHSSDISGAREAEINARLAELKKYLDSDEAIDNIIDDKKYLDSKAFPKSWTTDGSLLLRIMVHTPSAVLDASEELFTNPKFIEKAVNLSQINPNVYRFVIDRFAMLPEGEQKESTKLLLRQTLISYAQENEDFLVNMDADTVEALGLTEHREQLEQKNQEKQNVDETAKQPNEPQPISPEEQAKHNMDQRLQGIKPERVTQSADDLRKARAEKNRQDFLAAGRKLREDRIAREQAANKQQEQQVVEDAPNAEADAALQNEQPAPQQEEEVRAKKASKNVILNFFKKVSVTFQDVTSKVLGRLKQDKKTKEQVTTEPELDTSKFNMEDFLDKDWVEKNSHDAAFWRYAAENLAKAYALLDDVQKPSTRGKTEEEIQFSLDLVDYEKLKQNMLDSPFISQEIKQMLEQDANISSELLTQNSQYVQDLIKSLSSESVLGAVNGELLTEYNENISRFISVAFDQHNDVPLDKKPKLHELLDKNNDLYKIADSSISSELENSPEEQNPQQEQGTEQEEKPQTEESEPAQTEVEAEKPEAAEQQPAQTEAEPQNAQPVAGQPEKRNYRDILARLGKPKANASVQEQPKLPEQPEVVAEQPVKPQAEPQNTQPAGRDVKPQQPQLTEAEKFAIKVNKDILKGQFSQEVLAEITANPEKFNSLPDYVKNDVGLMRQVILVNPEFRKFASDRVQGLIDANGNLVEEQKQLKEQQFEDMLKNTSANNVDSKYWSDPEFVEWFALNKLTSQSVLDAFIEKFDVDLLENDEFRTKLIKIVNKKEKDIIARNKIGQQLIDQVKNVTKVTKEQIEQEKKRLAQEYNTNTQINLSYKAEEMGLPDEYLDNMSR